MRLRSGEVVVDLGSGGGIDVLLAAKKVGPTGKAIGIDMTPEMVERAKDNAEFHLAMLDRRFLAGDKLLLEKLDSKVLFGSERQSRPFLLLELQRLTAVGATSTE